MAARTRQDFFRQMALALLAGDWTAEALLDRTRRALGRRLRLHWAPPLCRTLTRRFSAPPGVLELQRMLRQDLTLIEWLRRRRQPVTVDLPACGPAVMTPGLARFREWSVPALTTTGQVADWLGLTVSECDWLADPNSWELRRQTESARNYRYVWLTRPGRRARLIESPKPRLKALQRQILHEILDRVPVHPAAHAFRRGRSVATCLAPHVGQAVVWRADLQHFFPSLRRPRVAAVFRTLGYPDHIALLLSALCTNAAPRGVIDSARDFLGEATYEELRLVAGTPHLPQGAPTSPALANLIAFRLDCRLTGLAREAGARYTRYADDLVFSGGRDFARSLPRFRVLALAIVLDEGFQIRARKVRTMPAGQRQQAAGLILNERLNVPREDYDALRATLHNCMRFGPASQNRAGHAEFCSHLLGKISHVASTNPARGEKLRRLFERIEWDGASDAGSPR
ncbi:reverse transcriptase family protein [Planctellipticum variicoloris]|uniref:reverse transcriptase family protein n=1 Tax=Planctellipticum variicoloris TaxID=3064265 RepID=UPI003013A4FE|nr:reverse transcriptase family protein [Planctomycetaceae bacterium SH412]